MPVLQPGRGRKPRLQQSHMPQRKLYRLILMTRRHGTCLVLVIHLRGGRLMMEPLNNGKNIRECTNNNFDLPAGYLLSIYLLLPLNPVLLSEIVNGSTGQIIYLSEYK
jgi:hypothetical protein